MQGQPTRKYPPPTEVGFVIVASGAAPPPAGRGGGARAGRPPPAPSDFKHDEFDYWLQGGLGPKTPVTWRQSADQEAKLGQGGIFRASLVGGSSVHFTANFWRLHEIDFIERSRLGAVPGANLADWPITYADLEPYYTM